MIRTLPRCLALSGIIICVLASSTVIGQIKAKSTTASPTQTLPGIYAYLGAPAFKGGNISKRVFDSLLHLGVRATDSMGKKYPVSGFDFSYSERNLYEDSVGNLMYVNDYFTEYCAGDTITRAISKNIYYKTKPGDTAYFDNIKVWEKGRTIPTKHGMKFILTR